jgi:hypothetical protein
LTRSLNDLWARCAHLHRLTRDDLDDDAIRAATVVALAGLGTDRLDALLDLRDALGDGSLDEWANAMYQERV